MDSAHQVIVCHIIQDFDDAASTIHQSLRGGTVSISVQTGFGSGAHLRAIFFPESVGDPEVVVTDDKGWVTLELGAQSGAVLLPALDS
jgi:hypothetical protein